MNWLLLRWCDPGHRHSLAVVGDGGFQMTMCELATLSCENIPVNPGHQ